MCNNREIKLASKVTVGQYRSMEKTEDKIGIANFIYGRFNERYILPVKFSKHKNGFSIMANSCLMIETLESFYNGWKDTNEKGKGRKAFENFFKRVNEFSEFNEHGFDFYKHVRCGILHQAETTGGWRITRNGVLFNKDKKIINASNFILLLEKYLNDYKNELISARWDDPLWIALRKKMDYIINNCENAI